MAIPTTRQHFKEYCLRALGRNVIQLNVDDDQVEDRIDEALGYWKDFHDDAVMRTFLPYQVTATDIANQYIPMNEDVIGVTRILQPVGSSGVTGADPLYDLQYQWRLNDFLSYRMTETLDMFLMQRHLNLIDQMYVGEPGMEFNRHADRITIYWDWTNDISANDYIIVECYIALDPATYADIWSDRMLQKLAIAYIKRQWGANMMKYGNTQLLGGQVLNGELMYTQAMEEAKAAEEELRETYELPPRFITG